tara:strand:- start:51831 stop:52766 length:936 start_codon:yes stop_codon:yes gene_type:complete
MKNNTYKHREFIHNNDIQTTTLSPMLQKRIKGFEELLDDYEHAVDEDSEKMKAHILQLDMELEEDLYDEYEQWLENNDDIEEDDKEIIYTMSDGFKWMMIPKKKALELFKNNHEVYGVNRSEETEGLIEKEADLEDYEAFGIEIGKKKPAPKKETPKPKKETPPSPEPKKADASENEKHDEAIIERLFQKKQKRIGRTTLRELGFKGKLDKKEHIVGKYTLSKALFSYTYYLEVTSNNNSEKEAIIAHLKKMSAERLAGDAAYILSLDLDKTLSWVLASKEYRSKLEKNLAEKISSSDNKESYLKEIGFKS